ncbi:MAG: phytanoyl-CoA dioxygenase family protein [Planctomycetaceae bacterium]|nr:phytanoyl-CoA dioxygenase family protein [Planctomycetaceae bacterium]
MEPNFAAIPTQDALQEFERDLRFYPSQTTQPDVLSPADIEQYNRDGYLKNLRVYSPDEITGVRTYFDDLLSRVVAAGGDSYSISTAHMKYGPVYDMLTHPPIVAIVRDLLGEDVIGWGSHFFCKMPHDGKAVAWHQDASYWPLSPSKALTVWLAIDKADLGNGCMKFIAGSHHKGHLTYRESTEADHNVLNQTIDNPEQYGHEVIDELEAGEVSIHSDLLLHGSEANNSDRRRCGLTLRYCTPDVIAGSNWHAKGVVVSGRDYSGNWGNPARPDAT